jgi:hypothetical protein
MKVVFALVGGAAVLVAYPCDSALAQQAAETGALGPEAVRYNVTSPTYASSPLSPSSATTTVSPSSVPQAMERMDRDAVAELSLGTLYAGGKFGTGSSTRIWSSALGARLRLGDWKLSASLPWMRSRSTIFTGIDATPVLVAPNTSASKRTADGFGDLTLGAAYTIAPAGSPVEVELSGRAKLNTATKGSGLSSGKNDYAVGADLSVPMGRVTPFASFTYRFLGDTTIYQLRDGPAASAGISYSFGSDSFLLASYHYSRAATAFVTDAHELFAGASTRLARTPIRVTGFVTKGVSNGAADASAGLALSYGLTGAR